MTAPCSLTLPAAIPASAAVRGAVHGLVRAIRAAPFCLLLILAGTASAITPNQVELDIAELVSNHPGQQRPEMVYDPILNMVARAKAHDLAERAFFSHADPDGYGPNKAASLAGYQLPEWWGNDIDANFIESLVAEAADAVSAFNAWIDSPGHRIHVLGELPFFAEQTRYGVGYANVPGSPHIWYYVLVTAPPNLAGDQPLEPYAEWLFSHYKLQEIDLEDDASDTNNDFIPRIIEFALDLDPSDQNSLPSPVFNNAEQRLEWTLPVRPDLGSVQFEVQYRGNLLSPPWSAESVERNGSVFSSPAGLSGFLRISAVRE